MKVVIKADGDIVAVYNDKIPANKLGTSVITRASNVEFNHNTNLWEARLPDAANTLIASGPLRDDVIRQEVAYLEARFHSL